MSSPNSYLVDQKLHKYHRMIEREKAEDSYSSSYKANSNNQYFSNEKSYTGYNATFSNYGSPSNQNYKMAPYSSNDDISISSLRSQKQRRSQSPNIFGFHDNDSSDDLLKESTRMISKIERHTRSSSSSRAQSPISSRSNASQTTPVKQMASDEDRDLQISDLESSPNRNAALKNSIDHINSSDRTSPLKALKRGLSSLFMSQVNKKNQEKNNSKNQYQTNIRTITRSSPRSHSLANTHTSTILSSIDKYEKSSWMQIPAHHSPNFILSDGSNSSPTQKVYNSSRSSSPINYFNQNSPKSRQLNNSAFNSYRSSFQNSNRNDDNKFSSPSRNSSIRSRSPPSQSYQIRANSFDSDSDSTEENFLNQTNNSKNFSAIATKQKTTASFTSKFLLDDDSSSTTNDQVFNQFQRNDNFSLKYSSSKKPAVTRYTELKTELNSSSDTEENLGALKYDVNGELKIPKAETKLTKKFSKQISNLLSPENQRTNGLLMISDSDSSSSNFHPKPLSRPILTTNRNVFTTLSSSDSSDSLFNKNTSNVNVKNKSFNNDSDSESSSNFLNAQINSSNFQSGFSSNQSNRFSFQRRNETGGFNSRTSFTTNLNLDESDSDDEFFDTLKKAIRENDEVLNSIRV